MRKYYVGAKHIGAAVGLGMDAGCMRETPEHAIEEATKMIQESNGSITSLVVVEVIAIVKRSPPPVEVEYIRDRVYRPDDEVPYRSTERDSEGRER